MANFFSTYTQVNRSSLSFQSQNIQMELEARRILLSRVGMNHIITRGSIHITGSWCHVRATPRPTNQLEIAFFKCLIGRVSSMTSQRQSNLQIRGDFRFGVKFPKTDLVRSKYFQDRSRSEFSSIRFGRVFSSGRNIKFLFNLKYIVDRFGSVRSDKKLQETKAEPISVRFNLVYENSGITQPKTEPIGRFFRIL